MPVPWTAPLAGQGIYPSQAPFFIPDRVDPRLVAEIAAGRERQQQAISGAVQGAIGTVGKFLQERRQDAIANQIMNQYQAPRAAAVNPAAYDPALAASQGLNYAGTPIPQAGAATAPTGDSPEAYARDFPVAGVAGPAATPAFRGGQAGLAAAMQVRSLESQDLQNAINSQYKIALTNKALAPERQVPLGHVYSDIAGGYVTPYQKHELENPKTGGAAGPASQWKNAIVTARGNMVDGVFVGDPNGPYARVKLPTGKTLEVPYESFVAQSTGAPTAGAGMRQTETGKGGYIVGKRYGGRLYIGPDPFNESSWQ